MIQLIKRLCLPLLLLMALHLNATDWKPWYPRSLQLLGQLDYTFQTFNSVATKGHKRSYRSCDHFITNNVMGILEPYSIELETQLADTRKRHLDWDHISLTGRYLLLDDDIGDPISLSTGLTFSRAWREAVNDIGSFHHGRNEAIFHVAIGKQEIVGAGWISRKWAVLGIGTADRWTPWLIANAAYEWNFWYPHRWGIYLNSLWGMGKRRLNIEDFGGYGPIAHRSVDLSIRYTFECDYMGCFYLDYSYRIYAHNFPNHASRVSINYIYPFGPEADFYLLKFYTFLGGKASLW